MHCTCIIPLLLCSAQSLAYDLRDFTQYSADREISTTPTTDLHYVYVLIREGMTNPEVKVPDGTPLENEWKQNKGQLNSRGEKLMTFTSQALLSRYKGFLENGNVAVSYSQPTDVESGTYPSCDRVRQSARLVEAVMSDEHRHVALDPCYDYLANCKDYAEKRRQHSDPGFNYLYSDNKPTEDLYHTETCTIENMRKLYEDFVIENFKLAMKETTDFVTTRRDYLIHLTSKYLRRVSGFYHMHDYEIGRLHYDLHNDLRQGQVRMRIHVADEVIASAFFSELTEHDEYAQYGDAFIIEVGKPPGRIHNPLDKYSKSPVKVFHYSPLKESDFWSPRFMTLRDKSLFLPPECTRYMNLHQDIELCPLKYFRCDHRPFSPQELTKLCDPPEGHSTLLDKPYESQCTSVSLRHYREEDREKKIKEQKLKRAKTTEAYVEETE